MTTFDRKCVQSHRVLCPYWEISLCCCKYCTEISPLTTDSWTDILCFEKPGGKCVLCEKCTELAPTSIDFWQHCKWLMKPTTLRLLAPQVSHVNHFLVWWTFVRIRVNNFSSSKSCNKIKRHTFLQGQLRISFTTNCPKDSCLWPNAQRPELINTL